MNIFDAAPIYVLMAAITSVVSLAAARKASPIIAGVLGSVVATFLLLLGDYARHGYLDAFWMVAALMALIVNAPIGIIVASIYASRRRRNLPKT